MELSAKLLTLLGLAALELWAAVPAGFAMQLHPAVTASVSAAGSILAAVAVILLGERLRGWVIRVRGGKEREGEPGRIRRIWDRYGVVGLGLLSPLLTGAPLGAALGVAFGAPAGRLLLWMTIGIVLWSLGLTVVGIMGQTVLDSLRS